MLKKLVLWIALLLIVPSLVSAAGSAFEISNDAFTFPDGSMFRTAPKDGKSILNGSGPPSIVGNIGDFYIDMINNRLYGPYAGSWGTGVSLIGPQGPQGPKGDTGATGGSGLSVVDGNGTKLGMFMGLSYNYNALTGNNDALFTYLSDGYIYTINASQKVWEFPDTYLYYSGQNCSGTAYVSDLNILKQVLFTAYQSGAVGDRLYKVSNVLPSSYSYQSYSGYGYKCNNSQGTTQLLPAIQVGVVPLNPVGPITIQ